MKFDALYTTQISGFINILYNTNIWNLDHSIQHKYLEFEPINTTQISGNWTIQYNTIIWNYNHSIQHKYLEFGSFNTTQISGIWTFCKIHPILPAQHRGFTQKPQKRQILSKIIETEVKTFLTQLLWILLT